MSSIAGPVLTIDVDAVVANYRLLADRVRPAKVAAVVKADAYGLGAIPIGRALARAGCETFFVAHVEEGMALRDVLPKSHILVLHGFYRHAMAEFASKRLIPVLSSLEQVEAWLDCGRGHPSVLHFDTGMSRLGLTTRDAEILLSDPQRLKRLNVRLVMSHLACADDLPHPKNREQLDRFEAVHQRFGNVPGSLCSSGGCFLSSEFMFDWVRPGIALYGGNPLKDGQNPMNPVVELTTPLLQVRTIDSGESVGYGATYVASGPRRLGVAAIGYADGLIRALGNRGHGVIAGVRCPIVGRVSMDLATLDVSTVPAASLASGTPVEFIGPHQPVDVLAKAAGTLAYEVLTRLGPRVERRYVGVEARP
ncbi:MAG: alanine racemase [Alphaproteobacteria bacterium]|nr:alanine racemase [Alphaproteobacteria bacterium]